MEWLEPRTLLAADALAAGSALHNASNALDVNGDGTVSPIDALLVLGELNAQGAYTFSASAQSATSAPRAAADAAGGGSGTPALFLDTSGDGQLSPIDALLVIRALNDQAGHDVRIRLQVTDTGGTPITSISQGRNFVLQAFVQDVRDGATMPGVGIAYTDVTFNSSLATPSGPIVHSTDYPNAPAGSTATAGLIDEAGGLQSAPGPLGSDEFLLFSVQMLAAGPGVVTFTADPADISPQHDTALFEPPAKVLPANIDYGSVSLTIDALPRLSVTNQSIVEGNAGTTTMTFTVTLDKPSDQTITVNYATAPGTAVDEVADPAHPDFQSTSGLLSFDPQQTSKTVQVTINGDTTREQDEQFFLNLSTPSNATIDVAQVAGTITNDDPIPNISVDDPTIVEGTGGAESIQFTISLTNPSSQTITVQYATSPGTATANVDYASASGVFAFEPGETSKTLAFALATDAVFELDETFFLNLTNAQGATIAKPQGTATITNDDAVPTLSIDSPAVITEPTAGTTQLVFTVTKSGGTEVDSSVHWTTAAGTADDINTNPTNQDFQAASGDLTFAPGETTKTIAITINADNLNEANEQFFVNLSAPMRATIGTAQGVGTIADDGDPVPAMSISPATAAEGNTGTTPLVFTVTLDRPSGQTVTVNFATAEGGGANPATEGTDYDANSGTLTFAAGETSKTITVNARGDTTDEPDETFLVKLSAATHATIEISQATGTITDDDPLPAISVDDPSIVEGTGGSKSIPFAVTLSNPSSQTITVQYGTTAGTAQAGVDFASSSGVLTFAPGETSKPLPFAVATDSAPEPDETFFLNLHDASGATITKAQGTATIVDDDGTIVSVGNASVAEGNTGTTQLTFTVTLSEAVDHAVTVGFATADAAGANAATAGTDYTAKTGTVTILANQTSATFTVDVTGDTTDEPDETFLVNLSAPTGGAALGTSQATGTITNDDLPAISVDDPSIVEGTTGQKSIQFTVTLSNPSSRTITVGFATAAGTATATTDFASASGVVTFQPGETSKTLPFAIVTDSVIEPDETFFLNLSNAQGATITKAQGTATIVNDDGILSIAPASIAEGNSGTTALTYTVTLSSPVDRAVTVNFATAPDTTGAHPATEGTDYTANSGAVTFAPNETTKSITVTVKGDTTDEFDETFLVNLSSPTGGVTIGTSQAIGTIINDDQPTVSIADKSVTEGDTGDKTMTFNVTLSAASVKTVTVHFATAGDKDATEGNDYLATSGDLTFDPGQTSKTISVTVKGDTQGEPNERFDVNLSDPSNATIGDGQAVGTITNDDLAVSIASAAVTEGNTGTPTKLVFTVTLSQAVDQDVTVNFATATGGANPATDADFAAKTGTVTILANHTTAQISIDVKGDTLDEPDETFLVNLTDPKGPNGIGLGTSQATGTILDDDPPPAISIADASVAEGNAGDSPTMTFTVSLPVASGKTVTVNFATAGDLDATEGTDYTASSGALTFAPGETTKSITVTVKGDTTPEANEHVHVNLTAPSNATIADGQAVGTISNDDGLVASVATAAVAEGNSGTTPLIFTVTLTQAVNDPVTLNFSTAPDTGGANPATADIDYVPKTGTVTIPANQTTAQFSIDVKGDTANEPDETFLVNLSAPTGGPTIVTPQVTGTITNDDPLPAISITDAKVAEGDTADTPTMTFNVTLSAASGKTVTVHFATGNDTTTGANRATAGTDYTANSGDLTFAPGEISKQISVTVKGDTDPEQNETFLVNLSASESAPLNATIADGLAVGTIRDDEPLTVSIEDAGNFTEGQSGTQNFIVRLSHGSDVPVDVDFATIDGTAKAGEDYTARTGSLHFAADVATQTISITVTNDTLDEEDDETYSVKISNARSAGGAVPIADDTGDAIIVDNDNPPRIVFTPKQTQNEGDFIPVIVRFDLFLVNASGAIAPSAKTVSVDFTTADDTALAGIDYIAKSGTITFAPGETKKQIEIESIGNTTVENDKQLQIDFTNPVNSDLTFNGQPTGTLVLANDDATGSFSGSVYVDTNNDGTKAANEKPLGGVTLTLTGKNIQGTAVHMVTTTASDGSYSFQNLLQSDDKGYTVTESQPAFFTDGKETPASGVTSPTNDQFSFVVTIGFASTGNNFGERGLRPELVTRRLFMGSQLTTGLVSGVQITGGEIWFAVDAQKAGTIRINATSPDPAAKFVLTLYNSNMVAVATSGAASATPEVSYSALAAGAYLLRITGTNSLVNVNVVSPT
ncbi:MAG: hypothetical protein HYX69_03260 [Planctomycetia bacterium]|nr:hypothetical protein [Planctomycetia bacterium]